MNKEHVPSIAVARKRKTVDSSMKNETLRVEDNIKKWNSFKEFQSKIESKLTKSEDTMLTVKCDHHNECGSDNANLVMSI